MRTRRSAAPSTAALEPGTFCAQHHGHPVGDLQLEQIGSPGSGVSAQVSNPAERTTSSLPGHAVTRATGRCSTSPMLTRTVRR